jgi:predicted deacylase
VLIIGGIHGDETSTIYAAEEYTKAKIEKGVLIVVPRTNRPAIAKNVRMINIDMNRSFSEQKQEEKDLYEYKVVEKLKELVAKSDLVLNLHEGRGFYLRTKIGMGQSVVADSDKILGLKTTALAAIKTMNKNIRQKKYYFKFNNHNTASAKTKNPEQKGSLTYYSVYAAGKPAFGVEISSDIKDSEYRVKLAMEAIDAFLKTVGIEHGF